MGKVVITSTMGGSPEIINNGVNGFLYKQFNTTTIVKRIDTLRLHRSKMIELNSRARENIMERFNIEIQAKKFIQFLQNL